MTEKPARQTLGYVSLPALAEENAPATAGAPLAEHRASAKAAPAQPRFAITGAKVWDAFVHRWALAVTAGLLLAAAGMALAWLTYQPKYTAEAFLQISPSQSRLLPGAMSEHADHIREEAFRKDQALTVKSRMVLDPVLNNANVRGRDIIREQEDSYFFLYKELQAGFEPGSNWLRIRLSGPNPEDVQVIVNEVYNEFKTHFQQKAKKDVAEQMQNVVDALTERERKAKDKKSEYDDYARRAGSGDPKVLAVRTQMVHDQLAYLTREKLALERDKRRTDAVIQLLRVRTNRSDWSQTPAGQAAWSLLFVTLGLNENRYVELPEREIDDWLKKQQRVLKQQVVIDKIEDDNREAAKSLAPSSPLFAPYQKRLDEAYAKLEKIKQELYPEARREALANQRRRHDYLLKENEDSLRVINEQYDAVAKQVDDYRDSAEKLGRQSLHLESLAEEIKQDEIVLGELRRKRALDEVENFNRSARIMASQPAQLPTINQASLVRTGSLYSIAGLLLGVVGVSYFEARTRRVNKSAEVHQELGIKTLAVLPLLTQADSRAYGQALQAGTATGSSLFMEAINGLCATLLCDDRLKRGSVLMMTSASENEGKTLVATQLAAGLARTGRKILLVDCDFRNPRCHKQFQLENGPGLCEVLRGEVELAAALQAIPDSEAMLLTAGASSAQVVHCLSNGSLAALLARLRQEFDCIIIDSAPTLVISDGLLIGKLTDGVIMVVRPRVSKAPAVFSAHEQLSNLKIPTLGVVVNANPARTASSYYSRY